MNFRDKGVWLLSECYLPKLTCIALYSSAISENGVKALTKIYLPWLSEINISKNITTPALNDIGDRGVRLLSTGNWPKLQDLGFCKL